MKFPAFQMTRYLLLITVVTLVTLGIGSLFRIGVNPGHTTLYIFYAIAMFGDGIMMGTCAWQLPKKKKFVFFFSVFILVLNIIPTIFDQFGLADLLFVLLNIATLVSLVVARKEFLLA